MSFPTKHDAFHTYIGNAVTYLNTNAIRLAIAAANLTAINAKKTIWDTEWAKYIDPALVTSQVRTNITNMIKDWKTLLSSVYNDFPNSVLTSTDGSTLNIALGASRTHSAPADHAPSLHIEETTHLQIKLRIIDPNFPTTKAMPAGQHTHVHVGIQDTPGSPIIWDILRLLEVHKFLETVPFTDADLGKRAHFRTCYVNTRGEKGPYSDVISTIIA